MATKWVVKTLTINEAVQKLRDAGLHFSRAKIECGILQGIYPWGEALKMKNIEYTVYDSMLEKWIAERGKLIETEDEPEKGKNEPREHYIPACEAEGYPL